MRDKQQEAVPSCMQAYHAPEFECNSLAAVVLSGATGGGDSGFTGFKDEGQEGSGLDEDDFYFG